MYEFCWTDLDGRQMKRGEFECLSNGRNERERWKEESDLTIDIKHEKRQKKERKKGERRVDIKAKQENRTASLASHGNGQRSSLLIYQTKDDKEHVTFLVNGSPSLHAILSSILYIILLQHIPS